MTHRFHIQGGYAHLTFSAAAELTAPWTVLFGPSGSGKSTLLRALAGLNCQLATTFERWDGTRSAWQGLHKLAPEKRGLALDPQGAPLLPHLTVAANIAFPERIRGITPAQSAVPELCDILRLHPLLNKRPQSLSGGERQRVSLARALAVPDATLLLLDEPFAGLDRGLRDQLVPHITAYLAGRKLPVLSVTHDPDEALLLGAEVLRLDQGKVTAQGPVRQVLADEILRLKALLTDGTNDPPIAEPPPTCSDDLG